MTLALLAFSAGVLLVQLQPELPPVEWVWVFPVALLISVLKEKARTPAALVLGFCWALGLAHLRLADRLAPELEGRDVTVVGVVASLPATGERSVRFEFEPETADAPLLFACLWDRWVDPTFKESDLLSFAIITDDPPPEAQAPGHDRCPISLKEENLDRWLTPQGRSREELYAILDDRERPYFEHQLAKAA
jgi:hypothetical protein